MTVVLDSWAVLRDLEDEGSAAQAVSDLFDRERPVKSWICLGEVHSVLRRAHGEDEASEAVRDVRSVVERDRLTSGSCSTRRG